MVFNKGAHKHLKLHPLYASIIFMVALRFYRGASAPGAPMLPVPMRCQERASIELAMQCKQCHVGDNTKAVNV